ncbi:MAG: DNA-methyltransferase [Planctomycetota bacterium]|jgi:site-specific DNA-methyltransferase (adenine-specific)
MEENGHLDVIFCEDCVEGMRTRLPEASVDVIVTSPPYNIGVRYDAHDDDLPFEDYLDWMERVAGECRRVLKEDGSFFLNIGDRPSDELRSLRVAERARRHFRLQNTIHWIKSIAAPEEDVNMGHYKPVNSPRYLNGCHEFIFHFSRTGSVPLDKLAVGVPYQDKSNIGRWKAATRDLRDRGNTWFIPYATVTGAKPHPAAFPDQLPEMCIRLHGVPEGGGLVVLDPFMGTGTTALAARRLGCRYVGFEISREYAAVAEQRLAQEQSGEEPSAGAA